MSDKQTLQEVNEHMRHGKIILIVALASILGWLVISDGYHPRLGPIASFYYSMTVYESKWFCHDVKDDFVLLGRPETHEECTDIAIYTKYLVLLSIIVATYGFLMLKGLAPDPVPPFRSWIQRRRAMPEDAL